MKPNVRELDRWIRFCLALVLAASIGFGFLKGPWAVVAALFALMLAITGAVRVCPLYSLLGFHPRSLASANDARR